ncbi:MAG: serine/threonine protein kinase [Mycobacterium sp.]|nr:MAG: serine/threonine protein kinase [Mycobacterium sp.]
MAGSPFGRYALISLLGRGGMGEVWRAYDTVTDRVVAIKTLLAQYSDDPKFQKRFRREAQTAARLNSPHVIPIYDYGVIEGRLYVSMRLIDGRDLQAVLAEGPLQADRAVRIIEQVAKALHAAHDIGFVHRDVKPSNVLLDKDDFAYLIDFGIARATDDTRLTGTGNAIGTFQYMAPERMTDNTDDPRADIYALTCVLYECLTGRPPFAGSTTASLIYAHLHAPPPQPSTTQPDVPATLDAVIATGMAKEPNHRYATTVELAAAAHHATTTPISRADVPAKPIIPSAPNLAIPGGPPNAAPARRVINSLPSAPPTNQPSTIPPPARRLGSTPPDPHRASPAKKARPNRSVFVLAAVAAVVIVVVVATLIIAKREDKPTSATANPTGPFTGTFSVVFGPLLPTSGGEIAAAATGMYAIRSTCPSTGCVATAKLTGPDPGKSLVLDQISAQWVGVDIIDKTSAPQSFRTACPETATSELWEVLRLTPSPNGTAFSGDETIIDAHTGCQAKRSVSLTRIAVAEEASAPDPASQPPRTGSPADALHGRYRVTYNRGTGIPAVHEGPVLTSCLRAQARCISSLVSDPGGQTQVLRWVDSKWLWNLDYKVGCDLDEKQVQLKASAEFPLPDPPQNPITLLTGRGWDTATGGTECDGQTGTTTTYQRLGD